MRLARDPRVLGVLGTLLLCLAWEAVGASGLGGFTWPPLSRVVAMLADPDRWELFGRAAGSTLASAVSGYIAGALAGVALAMLTHFLPPLAPGADRLAAGMHAIPTVALAPVFLILLPADATAPTLAGIGVAFLVYVAASSGLRASSAAHRDLFQVLGSRPGARLWRLDLPAGLPSIATGLRLAVPAALIGAVIGEWFGAPRGLGVLIVNGMQNFQIVLLWSAVLLVALISLTAYLIAGAIERAVHARFR
ncbi:ABC transporter permease subunit [Pararoseomonas sp. SCSIO 73927]|uniref:ABC transporter permease n=1 Tax=Pararoseomonas sp. SCSIO 73927 TaxID=3114537 RepID=UPI0030D0540C